VGPWTFHAESESLLGYSTVTFMWEPSCVLHLVVMWKLNSGSCGFGIKIFYNNCSVDFCIFFCDLRQQYCVWVPLCTLESKHFKGMYHVYLLKVIYALDMTLLFIKLSHCTLIVNVWWYVKLSLCIPKSSITMWRSGRNGGTPLSNFGNRWKQMVNFTVLGKTSLVPFDMRLCGTQSWTWW
jgi:hypothetical protein